MSDTPVLDRRLRIAALLVFLGLVVEAVSLNWHHPVSFIVFVGVGGAAMATGILLFFYSIVVVPRSKQGG
jgi:hypothetical protein